MANTVGSLVVKLSAHIAEWTAGLQKGASDVQRFSTDVSRSLSKVTSQTSSGVDWFGPQKRSVKSFADWLGPVKAQLAPVQTQAKDFSSKLSDINKLLMVIGKSGMGGEFSRFNRFSSAIAGIAGVGPGVAIAVTGVASLAAVAVGATAAAIKMGQSFRDSQREATRLGVSFEELRASHGLFVPSQQAKEALSGVAVQWEKIWNRAKGTTAELLAQAALGAKGQSSNPAMNMAMLSMLGPGPAAALANVLPDTTDQQAALDRQQAAINKLKPARAIVDGLSKAAAELWMNESQLSAAKWEEIAQSIRNVAGPRSELEELAKAAYDSAEAFKEMQRASALAAAEAMVTTREAGSDEFDESLDKLQKLRDAFSESGRALAENLNSTPITRFTDDLNKLYAAFEDGLISTKAEFDSAKARLREKTAREIAGDVRASGKAASAVFYGSQEDANMWADRGMGGGRSQELEVAREQLRVLQAIRDKNVVVEGAIQ